MARQDTAASRPSQPFSYQGARASEPGTRPASDWTPDGRWITTASEDGSARVWDAATGRQLFAVSRGHPLAAVPSPDGRTLAVSDVNTGTVRLLTLDADELVVLAEHRVTRTLTAIECRTFGLTPGPTNVP